MLSMLAYTSSNLLMSVPATVIPEAPSTSSKPLRILKAINPFGRRQAKPGTISFANNFFILALGWSIFTVVVIADIYALVQLGRGEA